jgi:AraC family transcriptional regulator of arabinose operon
VEEIAGAAGVSEVYLRKLFRQHLNKTPHEFLLEERLARGKDLLLHSEATIDQVASWAGFENPSYFHRVFKHHFGTSPGAYRRQPAV